MKDKHEGDVAEEGEKDEAYSELELSVMSDFEKVIRKYFLYY